MMLKLSWALVLIGVLLKYTPYTVALGEKHVKALFDFRALSGCDTTGCILGKSKHAWLNAFMKSSGEVINALCGLGISNEPSEETLRGCE